MGNLIHFCGELLDSNELDDNSIMKKTRSLGYHSMSDAKAEAAQLAHYLCQCMEYCFRPELGMFSAQATCTTQWALRQYYRKHGTERELLWCHNIKTMQGPNFRSGLELMSFQDQELPAQDQLHKHRLLIMYN
jgi:hypothetical protein